MTKILRGLSVLILAAFCITEAASAQTAPPMPPSSAMPAHPPNPSGTPLPKKCQKQNGCKKNKKKKKKKNKTASTSPQPMAPTSSHAPMSPVTTPHPTLPAASSRPDGAGVASAVGCARRSSGRNQRDPLLVIASSFLSNGIRSAGIAA